MNGSATARISMAVTTRVSDAVLLERILHGQAVDDGGEHAHVIAGGAIHALRAGGHAAEDVAAANDDADFDAEALNLCDVCGDAGGDVRDRCRRCCSPISASPDSFSRMRL